MKTLSNRTIPDPPKIRLDSNRKCINDLKKLRIWLKQQAFEEAKSRNDDWCQMLFEQIDTNNMSQSDCDSCHLYLFGTLH